MPDEAGKLPGVEMTVANVARMWDYYLGGSENSEADREAARLVLGAAPDVPLAALENREFLKHAVRFLVTEAHISQFIDIGPGLPTRGNIHQLVRQYDQHAPVAYVDNDPDVLARGCAHLNNVPGVTLYEADPKQVADMAATLLTGQVRDYPRLGDGYGHETVTFKGIVGLELKARGFDVGLEVYEDEDYFDARAEIVVTSPDSGGEATVHVTDDGSLTWTRDYWAEAATVIWEPHFCGRISDLEKVAGAVVATITAAMSHLAPAGR